MCIRDRKYLGHLNDPSLDMYVYGEVYYDDWTNPDAPETKPLIPDNMIILISSRPNYMMAYGACTYIEDASGLWVTSQTSRVLRSYCLLYTSGSEAQNFFR